MQAKFVEHRPPENLHGKSISDRPLTMSVEAVG